MFKKILNISAKNWTILFLIWMFFMFWFSTYFELGLNWKLLIVIWTVIAISVRIFGFLKTTTINFKKLWLFSIFFYTIIETTIRIFISRELIENSWRFLNSLEHFSWMTFTLILAYPFFYEMLKKLNSFHKFLHLFGFLMTIGIFNEIFEYSIRSHQQIPFDKLAYYYKDTIYDLSINIPGVIFGMFLIYIFDRKFGEEREKIKK